MAVVAGCATAVDDQPTNLGTPVVTPQVDSGSGGTKDTSAAVDSYRADTVSPEEDSSLADTTAVDTETPPDTWIDPDTGVGVDTSPPDTFMPPLDAGGGACMYCSTGTCPTVLSDYSCLLTCLLDGYVDCHYDPAASMPCTCKA
jgi:hypothetical protein